VPDRLLLLQAVDDLCNLRLELPDVDRSGMHLRRGRLEDDETARQVVDGGPRQCRLPDTGLSDEEDGSPRHLLERFSKQLDELTAPADQQRRGPVEGPPQTRANPSRNSVSTVVVRHSSNAARNSGPSSSSKRSRKFSMFGASLSATFRPNVSGVTSSPDARRTEMNRASSTQLTSLSMWVRTGPITGYSACFASTS
jgi:hypothetical protein